MIVIVDHILNLGRTTRFWNNPRQARSKPKEWKVN